MNFRIFRVARASLVIALLCTFIITGRLQAQDSTGHLRAARELVLLSGVKEELGEGIMMVRGYGKLPASDTTVRKFRESYDALFADSAVYDQLASAYASAYDEKTIRGVLEWMGSDAYRIMKAKEGTIEEMKSDPADSSLSALQIDTAGSLYTLATGIARKEKEAERSAVRGMPGGGREKPTPPEEGKEERKLARIYAGLFDEPTLSAKLHWVNSDAYSAYTAKLPSVQMKCVMVVMGKLK